MKQISGILLMFLGVLGFSQNKFKQDYVEKTYLQLNNVLYQPGEMVFYKIFVTDANNQPLSKSDYVYVDIFDASNKKVATQKYIVKNGAAEGSFRLDKDISGLNKILAYTSLQNQTDQNIFEKTFFVQKVHSPNLIMALDFKKKAYGKGEICEASFSLKTNQNQPIRHHSFNFDVFLEGKLIETKSGKTNEKGETIISYQLPNELNSNDGLVNVKVIYDNQNESITRSIPLKLDHVDLQFLPESGHLTTHQTSKMYFIAKDKNGLPLDCKGKIFDENNNFVTYFESFHNGMGEFSFTPNEKNYYAILDSPFESQKIALPKSELNVFSISSKLNQNKLKLEIFAPNKVASKILIRNQGQIIFSENVNLSEGINSESIDTKSFPTGTYAISLFIENKIVAEKLFFNNYLQNLKINLVTDKNVYQPRELVEVEVETLDQNNQAVPSHLAISVVNEKTLAYINDKQHNILTWLLFGHEIKGKIFEPNFYFNSKEDIAKREKALDLLLNTHGWRKYHQNELNNTNFTKTFHPESINATMGFVVNEKNKPVKTKVYMIADDNQVYETLTDHTGYFSFYKVNYSRYAYIVAETGKKNHKIILSQTKPEDYSSFIKEQTKLDKHPTSTIINIETNEIENYKDVVNEEDQPTNRQSISMKGSNQKLDEVVVLGYTSFNKHSAKASVSIVSKTEITQNLQGKVAGINISEASGIAESKKILVRGASSIYGNQNNPLYIVDGVPVSSESFSQLSSDEIFSLNVIKDAAANTMYGRSGSNGVIVITTKKNKNQGISFTKRNKFVVEYLQSNNNNNNNLNHSAEFYAPNYTNNQNPEVKDDFRSCIYWNKTIQTNKNGKAKFSFYNSDEVTSFAILAEGISANGNVGFSKHNYAVLDPLETEVKLPIYASVGDEIKMPIRIKNNTNNQKTFDVKLNKNEAINIEEATKKITLNANESTTFDFSFQTNKPIKNIPIVVEINHENKITKIEKKLDSYAVGFPKSISFSGHETSETNINLENMIENTLETEFSVYNNRFEILTTTLDKMLREPHGCFEQVSSTNYPNIMIVKFLNDLTSFKDKREAALQFLKSGYKKLSNYKSKEGGYEWYGGNPGNEALTAYGLLQFNEMRPLIKIDENEFTAMKNWLLSRKDNKGGFNQVSGRYGFSGINPTVNNAYITYVLSEIGEKNIIKEYQTALEESTKLQDNYKMALMALTAFNLDKKADYQNLLTKIEKNIKDAKNNEIPVNQTVVNSYGQCKQLEFFALYGLALLKNKTINNETLTVLKYIESKQTTYGFGSTQANALCLKFIINYLNLAEENKASSKVEVFVNNELQNLSSTNALGNIIAKNEIKLNKKNQVKIVKSNKSPFCFNVNYQSYLPENSSEAMVELKTTVPVKQLKINDVCRINVELTNTENKVLFNPLVRIGIPGGLSPEPWQLKELIEKNVIDYYEIINNELILYFREINAKATRNIALDFKAIVTGKYKGKASSAYLYYNIAHKNYNEGIEVEVW